MKHFIHAVLVLLTALACPVLADSIKVSVKAKIPDKDGQLFVEGKLFAGSGQTRTVEATLKAPGPAIVVKAVWEPNNYTKITRSRTVSLKKDQEVDVDLTREDPKQPDDIVIIYVPTPQDVVEAMCKLANVGPNDVVYDLGCGDGRFVITAVKKFGAMRGVGVDIEAKRIKEAAAGAARAEIKDKTEFRVGDVLKVPDMAIAEASVVFLYMGDHINNRLRPILQKNLSPGSRIVSHRFLMGDWKPDRTLSINSVAGYPCEIHLWEIKAAKK